MTLALDTNIFISSLVSYEKDSKLAVNLIRDIINGKYKAIASSVVYGEIISIPLNSTKPSPMSFISRINNLNTVPADDDICLKAAEIRKNEGSKVKLIDTLHLATALLANADSFITNDKRLLKVAKKYISCRSLI